MTPMPILNGLNEPVVMVFLGGLSVVLYVGLRFGAYMAFFTAICAASILGLTWGLL